jgi:DNA-binding response OmpR family regulator
MIEGFSISRETRDPSLTSRPLRILVADDERDTVLTLITILRDEGHDARGVYDSYDVVRAVRDFDPDAVILDIAMPGKSGWHLARELRATLKGARPLLIAISGRYKQYSDKLLAKITGFNHHLAKPYETKTLLDLLAPLSSPSQDA